MVEVMLRLAGYCPSCGAEAVFTPIGDQEMGDGRPSVALGNCSACGSTVALSSVESVLKASWPEPEHWRRCSEWTATVSGSVGGYPLQVSFKADGLPGLLGCIRAAVSELHALGMR
jgi:Fe-S cluster biogenesis protein NfuA